MLNMTGVSSPAFALVALAALVSVQGEDAFDRIVPGVISHLKKVASVLLPLPDSMVEEAAYHAGTYLIPLDSETELCRNHSDIQFQAYLRGEHWALKMMDAASKIPSGLLEGHALVMGSFDECLGVEEPEGRFRGQYCFVQTANLLSPVVEKFNLERAYIETPHVGLAISLCVPSSCTLQDVKAHMDVTLNSVNATALLPEGSCSSSIPEPLTAADWFALVILALIISLMVVGTVHDYNAVDCQKNRLLTSFSVGANLPRMLDTSSTGAALTCLNGLRVAAMAWVMLGHRMLYSLASPNIRMKTLLEMLDDLSFAPILNTQLSVEVFFLMSGILVSYSYLRYRHNGRHFTLTEFYLLRYLRMTPPLAFMALLQATVLIRITDGPNWKFYFSKMQHYCQTNWWSTLLYIGNYVNPYEICVQQAWYLAADFQMYIFSPLLLIPLYRRSWLGLILTFVCVLLTTAAGLWNAYTLQLKAGAFRFDRSTERNVTLDYMVTHVRATSFCIGVAMGCLLLKIKQGSILIKLSKGMKWAGWLVSLFLILFSVFFVNYFHRDPDNVYSPVVDTLYLVLHRHLFSIGLCWVILVCTLGYGGPVDKFLSWPGFVPLARLTYCAFLVHVTMQAMQVLSERTPGSISYSSLYFKFLGDFFICYLTAGLLYLMVEAPSSNLINLALERKKQIKNEVRPDSIKQLQTA